MRVDTAWVVVSQSQTGVAVWAFAILLKISKKKHGLMLKQEIK